MRGRRFGSRGVDQRVRSRGRVFGAETLESRQLLATFTVTNLNNAGVGSLRDAIGLANVTTGADTIAFNVGGSGVRTINLATPLPAITDTLTIDGTTQPGYSNRPLIELNGTNAGTAANGLRLSAPTTVKALAINRFTDAGIRVESSGNVVQSSFIGVDPTGQIAQPNGSSGIVIDNVRNNTIGGAGLLGNVISGNSGSGIALTGNGANNNTFLGNLIGTNATGNLAIGNSFEGIDISGGSFNQIGGTGAGEGNLISGNGFRGISIFGTSSRSNVIQGNLIGTDFSGTQRLGNNFYGIELFVTSRNQIGGTTPEARNVISGNGFAGILVIAADQNSFLGNYIGVGADGTQALGNLGPGIELNGQSLNNTVGGIAAGSGNVIAYNGLTFNEAGVQVFSSFSTGNAILSNSIFSNVGLGIDLNANGLPEPNDIGDIDTGANELQNYPVVTVAKTGAGRTLVQGTLSSTPNTQFTVQLFSSAVADSSGFGEGQAYLGSVDVTTDASGIANFSTTLSAGAIVGQILTATATDPNGNTSEFSPGVPIEAGTVVDLAITKSDLPDPATRDNLLTYYLIVVNNGPSDANNVVVTDFLPSSVNFVSVDPGPNGTAQQAGANVVANYATLRAGETATVTITVIPTQTGTITNRAEVSSSDIDQDPLNNVSVENTLVNIPIDLQLTITAAPIPAPPVGQPPVYLAGQNLEYLLLVYNNGPGQATGVTLTADLPSDVIVIGTSTGQGSVQQVGNRLVVSLGTLNRDVPAAIRFVVQPTEGGTTNITATVTAREIDTVPGNDVVSLDTTVLAAADLVLTPINPPATVTSGGPLQYQYQLTNQGPSTANNVVVTVTLPPGVSFQSGQFRDQDNNPIPEGSVVANGATVVATLPSLPFGASYTLTLETLVDASATGTLQTIAILQSDEQDPVDPSQPVVVDTAVNPTDLLVSISTPGVAVPSGSAFPYSVTVRNIGTSSAGHALLTFNIPVNATLVGIPTASQGTVDLSQSGLVIVDFGTIAQNGLATLNLNVIPNPGAGNLVATATAQLVDQVDIAPVNNTAVSTLFVDAADLGITVSAPAGPIGIGGNLTYTITVTNFGPFTATNIVVRNPIPSGTAFVSATPGAGVLAVGQIGEVIAASIPSLAKDASASFQVVVKPGALGIITSNVSVEADQVDPTQGNNVATATTSVVSLPGYAEFAQTSYTANDRAGTINVTVRRTNGTSGPLTVQYQTIGGSAVPGLDFTSASGTLTFQDGETTKTFPLSTLVNTEVTGNRTLQVLLTEVGQGDVDGQVQADVTIIDSDADTSGPKVADIVLNGTGTSITTIAIRFDEALDPARAQDASNYVIAALGNRRKPGSPVAIASAIYDASNRTVVLTPVRPLPASAGYYGLAINGSTDSALLDRWGNRLDGDGVFGPGGDYVATFARGSSLNYSDKNGDQVSLRLTGGGIMDLVRGSDGEARILRITRVVRNRSTVTGSIRRGPGGDGVTSLGDVYGLGSFNGGAISRLTQPKFFANSTLPSASVARNFATRARTSAGLRLRG